MDLQIARLNERILRLLPEPMLLLRDLVIVAINPAAESALAMDAAKLEGASLADRVDDQASLVRYLKACSRSRSLLPGALRWRAGSGQVVALRCDGGVLEPATANSSPLLLLRLRTARDPSQQFVALTQKVNELTREIRSRKAAEDQLRELTQSLEQRVAERTRVAVQRARRLRTLALQLSSAEERERRRLAQVLHDDLQQLLVAARLRCGWLEGRGAPDDVEAASDTLELLTQALKLCRSITTDLSPPVVYDGGLGPGLQWLSRWMLERFKLQVEIANAAIEPPTQELRILVFQAVRELLFNVVKHAASAHATVRLHNDDRVLCVTVEDCGRGFDPGVGKGGSAGFGLFHLRERLEAIGGKFSIASTPGQGAKVEFCVPLNAAIDAPGEQFFNTAD